MEMRYTHVLALSAAASALLIFAASRADAQQAGAVGGVARNNFAANVGGVFHGGFHGGGHGGFRHGFHGGFGSVWVVEREVPVIVERVVEVPVQTAPPPAPSPEGEGKRQPYVVGASYDSLPGGCMKLIEGGASFFYCSGDWYREVRAGKEYRAISRRL